MSRLELARAMCAQAEEYLKQARHQVQNHDLIVQAIDLYHAVLGMDDVQIADPYLGLALLTFSHGDKGKAMGLLLTAKRLSPMNLRVNTLMQRLEKALVPPPPQHIHQVGVLEQDSADDHAWEQLQTQMERMSESVAQLSERTAETESSAIQRLSLDLGPPRTPGKTSQGPEVVFLQEILQKLGFKVNRSGQYDQSTQLAVRTFQLNQKLPLTGCIDVKTRAAFNHLLDVTDAEAPLLEQFEQWIADYEEAIGATLSDTCFQQVHDLWQRLLQVPQGPLWGKKLVSQEQLFFPLKPAPELYFTDTLGSSGDAGVISQGPSVEALQRFLSQNNYQTPTNSQFDLNTFFVLKDYQRDHQLEPTGMLDAMTRDYINRCLKPLGSVLQLLALLSKQVNTFQQTHQLPVNTAMLKHMHTLLDDIQNVLLPGSVGAEQPPLTKLESMLGPAAGTGSLQRVSQGPEVVLLQQLLRQKGYTLEVTGTYDQATTMAVRNLQLKLKLPLTGWLDARLRDILNKSLDVISPQ